MALFSQSIFLQYWEWYYIDQPKLLLKAWRNFLVFGMNFFSIPLLLRTLFLPWHRYYISYGRGFDIKVWLEAFSSNLIFRSLGAIARIIIIAFGIIFETFIFITGLIIFLGWLVLPFLLLVALALAFKFLLF